MSKWGAIDKLHSEFVSKLKEERNAGMSRRAIGMIESGEIKPTLYNCFRICDALGFEVKKLL
jgi:DNA-binding XRE family transcriptional regulator